MIISNVRYLMHKRKITILKLAEKAHMSPDTIDRVRRDISGCNLHTLEKVAKVLNCSVKDLFEDDFEYHQVQKNIIKKRIKLCKINK